MEIKSAYAHIPFCKKRCKYCSFVSYEKLELKNIYLDVLSREISKFYDKNCALDTLYLGGGTPSLLSASDFEGILSHFNFNKNAEITIEVNPESVSYDYLKMIKDIGANRLSIGVQSFNDEMLASIGRIHDSKLAIETVKNARRAGFSNVSIDLMYGLSNQSVEDFKNDLKIAKSLDIEHISLYGLKIEKGCYFYNNRPEMLADDDVQADMYLAAKDVFSHFYHYEVSNFAKNKNYVGKHNLNYWNLGYYYGFGLAASGFSALGRYSNEKNIEKYIKNPLQEKKYEKTNLLDEKIFLGFRKLDGIDVEQINKEFNIDFEKKYAQQIEKFKTHIVKTDRGYRLTTEGILVSNLILCEFLETA